MSPDSIQYRLLFGHHLADKNMQICELGETNDDFNFYMKTQFLFLKQLNNKAGSLSTTTA
jgi:hypothetical protein